MWIALFFRFHNRCLRGDKLPFPNCSNWGMVRRERVKPTSSWLVDLQPSHPLRAEEGVRAM
jgi:hypothetical protein